MDQCLILALGSCWSVPPSLTVLTHKRLVKNRSSSQRVIPRVDATWGGLWIAVWWWWYLAVTCEMKRPLCHLEKKGLTLVFGLRKSDWKLVGGYAQFLCRDILRSWLLCAESLHRRFLPEFYKIFPYSFSFVSPNRVNSVKEYSPLFLFLFVCLFYTNFRVNSELSHW